MISIMLAISAIEYSMVAYAAYYRLKFQDSSKPEIKHVPYTGFGCVISAIANIIGSIWFWNTRLPADMDMVLFLMSLGQATGMGSVSVSIFLTIKDIAAQPIRLTPDEVDVQNQERDYKHQQIAMRLREERRQVQLQIIRARVPS